jgi:hypothetical protein
MLIWNGDMNKTPPTHAVGKMSSMTLPKLHLRDLFWLVLVCACLCAWWLDSHARWVSSLHFHVPGRVSGPLEPFDKLVELDESETP